MSNRACNYCVFQLIKKSAEKEGKTIETKLGKSEMGGVDVFVDGKWRCWFMELPDSCRC